MNNHYDVVASKVFKQSLARFKAFLRRKYGEDFCKQQVMAIKAAISERLGADPYIAPVSERLLALGVAEYRQWSIDQHNVLFFKVDEDNKKVELLAIMDARQSIQKLLYEVILLS